MLRVVLLKFFDIKTELMLRKCDAQFHIQLFLFYLF